MRMLDNVIDINYYAVKKARDSNLRHRPVGLGIMGFQDALYELRMPYASRGGGRVRRPLDGSGLLPRLLGLDRAGRASAAATRATAARCGTAASCRSTRSTCWPSSAAATSRSTAAPRSTGTRCAQRISAARHAQLATASPSRRPRPSPTSSASTPRSSRRFGNLSVKSNLSGEFTDRQRVPGARPEEAGPVGRRDGDGPEALRRLAAPHRPRARGPEGALRDRVRGRDRSGWSRPRRGARSGSTRRSRSTSTWPARRARSSTRPTSSPGCAA